MAEPGSQETQIPAPTQKKEAPISPDKAPEKPIVPSGHPITITEDELTNQPKKQWIG